VATIDLKGMDSRLKNAQFIVACDVDNPCAEKKVPQLFTVHKKGNPDMVKLLDRNLSHLADVAAGVLAKTIEMTQGWRCRWLRLCF